jgi:uncharacterized protein YbjT (DUF2867 family)
LTIAERTTTSTGESHHQRLHYLSEQVLDWSALPLVHIRPTVLLKNPFFTTLIARSVADSGVMRLPFGRGHTSSVAAADVARTVAAMLRHPGSHIGRRYQLTGPRSQSLDELAREYADALDRPVGYQDVAPEEWLEDVPKPARLPTHLTEHLATMARLHRENRYGRHTGTVEHITGQPAETIEAFVAAHRALFE